ncbi:MAG: M48 family metallopeptidase [Deltaproteobacteria bacterium]|nr:M48 family metallopeptidase [Deltaproteobacteria bacterium]
MDDFFYKLGQKAGGSLRKGRWVWSSLTGSEAEALAAEYQAGCDLARALDAESRFDEDPECAELVAGISERLTRRLNNKQRRWRVVVTSSDEPNALALPGGFIYVSRGLLELCRHNADEIACVVGHEMGHVVHGHAMERLTNEVLGSAAAKALRAPGGVLAQWILDTGVKLLGRAYSRGRELQADEFGARLAAAAGYDPRGAIRAFERLRALQPDDEHPLAEYFATHPPLEERTAKLRALIRVRKS